MVRRLPSVLLQILEAPVHWVGRLSPLHGGKYLSHLVLPRHNDPPYRLAAKTVWGSGRLLDAHRDGTNNFGNRGRHGKDDAAEHPLTYKPVAVRCVGESEIESSTPRHGSRRNRGRRT